MDDRRNNNYLDKHLMMHDDSYNNNLDKPIFNNLQVADFIMEKKQSQETRLDRIEKGLELLLQGTSELKESQNRTEDHLNRTIERLDRIGRQLGDLGLVQGEVAEDLFYRNVRYLFKDRNITFGSVRRNLKKKGVAEYDIVAANGDTVLVIEVKNKLQKRMIDNFLSKRLPKFKQAFPQYRDYRLFGGIGALVIKDEVGRYAQKSGLYVLTQASDGGATLANRKNFHARDFS
jgi:hypothetical protein